MSEVGSMETGKAEDKVSISQRIVDFLLCQETPPENAKPTPKGSACTSPDKWDALRKAAEAIVAGRKSLTNWITFHEHVNPAAILELLSELRGMERGGEVHEVTDALKGCVRVFNRINLGLLDKEVSNDVWLTQQNAEIVIKKLATLSVTEGVDGREK